MNYDVIVVGGGICGLYFANNILNHISSQKQSFRLLLLERKSEFGKNIRCAQGVSLRWFKKYEPEFERFILNRINDFELYNSSTLIGYFSKEGEGAIINRKEYEKYLGEKLQNLDNVEIKLEETFIRAEYREQDKKYTIITDKGRYTARYLIGCDGVENKVARSLGYAKNLQLKDIDVCAYKVIEYDDFDYKKLRFYFGVDVAPGGYLWVFPQKKGLLNVGIGISGDYAINQSPVELLEKILERDFKESKVIEEHVAAIPTPKYDRPPIGFNFISLGDAGYAVNPFTRAGIVEALSMAYIAAKHLANLILANKDFDKKEQKKFIKSWQKLKAKYYPYLYELKLLSRKIDDKELIIYKNIIESIPQEKRTLWRVFRKILFKRPMLLWKIKGFWI